MRQTTFLKVVLPLAVIAVGAVGAVIMVNNKPEPETRVPEVPVPLVRFQQVELRDVQLTVASQGTVNPRTESTLVPEVAGRVVWVSPSFVSGGFFEAGATLLKIDPHDYREALVQARAAVAQSELRLASQRAEAELARREWEDLGHGDATPLTLREPQVAEAEAGLEASRAAVERARRNLDRTEMRAPYAGRLRRKDVDIGQYVTPGTPLARIYAVDFAEIRLPLPDDDLEFIDLPLNYRGDSNRRPGPPVVLRTEFAGKTHEWDGRIVRTEGEIDPRSRMIHAVAQVKDPYGRGPSSDRPPLAAGMFVEAEIAGRTAERTAVLPRSALRGNDRVLIVDGDSLLRFRQVEVLRSTRDEVYIRSGLVDGERVCLSPLAAVTDGMRVRSVAEDGAL